MEGAGYQLYHQATADPAAVAPIPPDALAVFLLGWFLGGLVGGIVALRLDHHRWTVWVVAGFVILVAITTFTVIPRPVWLIAGGILAPILAALTSLRICRSRELAREA